MTTTTLERPHTASRLDLLRTRPDFVLHLDRDGVRRLLADMLAGRCVCCETERGWNVWIVRREGATR